jgi:SAM-dependent methyltransferase
MSLLYELLYLVGVRPWEQGGIVRELRELVEGPEALTPGRALDIGCGTGGPSVYLALRRWDVTGVDVVARALAQARARARDAGVSLRLVHGAVTEAATEVAAGGPYRLLLDTGCYHGLDDAQRAAYADLVGSIAEEGAALLMFALTPGGAARPRTFRGAGDREIRSRFEPGWELVWTRPHAGPPVLGGAGQFWYLLKRAATRR